MKPLRRFAIAAGVTMLLSAVALAWLGPVWLHDVREHVIATISSPFLLLAMLSMLGGTPEPLTDLVTSRGRG